MSDTVHASDRFSQIDLGTLAGVQVALGHLGFPPGKVDGLDGPDTQAAVKAFQETVGLGVDGKVGPKTRAALLVALDHASVAGEVEAALGAATEYSRANA